MDKSYLYSDYRSILGALLEGELDVVSLVQGYFDHIEKANKKLNAYVNLTYDIAMKSAHASMERLRAGQYGLLEGCPVGIKEAFCTKGVTTTACSKILENFVPIYESTVTSRMWQHGAIMLGKTNMDEFSMGSSNQYTCFPIPHNPWGEGYSPGGSSGGSATAVASGMACAAMGGDTGGSCRQPASVTGLVGLRATYGLCSRCGLISFAPSLDQPGIISRSVWDVARILQTIAGHDPLDCMTFTQPIPNYSKAVEHAEENEKELRGTLRVGILKQYKGFLNEQNSGAWDNLLEQLGQMGFQIKELDMPHTEYALQTYMALVCAEASSTLSRYDGIRYGARIKGADNMGYEQLVTQTRTQLFGPETKRRIMLGGYILSSKGYQKYQTAQKVRTLIHNDFKTAFDEVDIVLSLTSPIGAFRFDEQNVLDAYKNDLATTPSSLAGVPAVSIPIGLDKNNMPVGVQIAAGWHQEVKMLSFARIVERAMDFTARPREWWYE